MTLAIVLLVYSTFVFFVISQKGEFDEKEKFLTLKKYYTHNIFTINLK